MSRVVVVGAGIGGLTASIALAADAHEVVLLERAAELRAIGAGLVMAPNAVAVLDGLGVDVRTIGRTIARSEIRTADGRTLQSLDVATPAAELGPMVTVARPDLHELLAARARAVGVDVRTGIAVAGVDPRAGVVTTPDGSEHPGDLVVGADGIGSDVRAALVGDWPRRYSGDTCWRGIVPDWGVDVAVEHWGTDTRIGIVPLRNGVYYYLTARAPAGEPGPTDVGALIDRFAEHTPAARAVFDALGELPPFHHDLWELERPTWGRDRVALLGDAAHAMTPNLGQGAAMAIEDAQALAVALRTTGDPTGAVRGYARVRHRRVRRVQLQSRRVGRTAAWRGARGRVVRGLLGAMPERIGATAYRRLVAPGVRR